MNYQMDIYCDAWTVHSQEPNLNWISFTKYCNEPWVNIPYHRQMTIPP